MIAWLAFALALAALGLWVVAAVAILHAYRLAQPWLAAFRPSLPHASEKAGSDASAAP